MFIPLFLAIIEKKLLWTAIITLSIFLSGSTTGIIVSMVMLGTLVLSKEFNTKYKVLFVVIGVLMVVLLFTSSFFEAKMEDTTFEGNARLFNGISLVSKMNIINWIFGVNYTTPADYYFSGDAGRGFLIEKYDTVYLASFWMVIIKFGIVGVILYLKALFAPAKKDRSIFIYVLVIFVTLFSNPDYIGAMYAFTMTFIYSYVYNKKSITI